MHIFVPSVEQETFTLKKKEFPELWQAEICLIHSIPSLTSWATLADEINVKWPTASMIKADFEAVNLGQALNRQ